MKKKIGRPKLDDSQKTVRESFTLTKKQSSYIKKQARKKKITKSEYFRLLIQNDMIVNWQKDIMQ